MVDVKNFPFLGRCRESFGEKSAKKRLTEFSGVWAYIPSKEELVAELGRAFLCAEAGIDNLQIENSAAYIQGWLKPLKNDKRLIVTASSQAARATRYILGQTEEE